MKEKFPDGWAPRRTVSREARGLLRLLHQSDPEQFTTSVLAERFRISPEAARRILKSKFELPEEEAEKREEKRWAAVLKLKEERGDGVTWAGDREGERREMDRLKQAAAAAEEEERSSGGREGGRR